MGEKTGQAGQLNLQHYQAKSGGEMELITVVLIRISVSRV